MHKSNDSVTLTTASGFLVLIWFEMASGLWVKDILADERYFNARDNQWHFERLVKGEACHQVRRGEDVKDKNLLAKLIEAKKQYFETQVGV